MRRTPGISTTVLLAWGMLSASGCAALRPLDGIPVSELPDAMRAPTRSHKVMLDLSLLRQTPPREHIVDADDVLGVYVEGILGGRQQAPPVNLQLNANSFSSLGYPIRVRADGTISLPGIDPIPVRGLTIGGVEKAVRTAYTTGDKAPLRKGMDRIIVNLQRPRHYRVLVIRQEIGNTNTPSGNDGQVGSTTQYNYSNNNGKFGMGRTVNLPAYKNDVLHALAETGGLPGLDAENVIYVIRRRNARRAGSVSDRSNRTDDNDNSGRLRSRLAPRAPDAKRIEAFPKVETPRMSIPTVPVRNLDRVEYRQTAPATRTIRNFDPPANADSNTSRTIIRGQSPGPAMDFSEFGGHSLPDSVRVRTAKPKVRPVQYSNVRTVSSTAKSFVAPMQQFDATINNPNVIRIPLRVFPGQSPAFSEEDITLQDGDVVLIEARDSDVFYTAGLLGGGRYRLPRDRDLNVLEALAMVQEQRVAVVPTRAIGGVTATNQDVTTGASDLIILRPCGDGYRQVAIRVNLYDALREPCQRINVRAGDQLVLQYTRKEAIVAFFERHVLDGAVLGVSSGLFFRN